MGPAEGVAMLGEIWKIGDWSVFPAENTLRRDGSEVKVPPRLMDALIFFARHPDHVISRTELVAHLWNRSVVTDQTVTQNIFELRKALRDGRGRQEAPEYIATVPKRGYQLVVDAELLRTAQTDMFCLKTPKCCATTVRRIITSQIKNISIPIWNVPLNLPIRRFLLHKHNARYQ